MLVFTLGSSSTSAGDSTTYYWGPCTSPLAIAGNFNPLKIGMKGKIVGVITMALGTNTPSNETYTHYLRKNNTTDITIETTGFDGVNNWTMHRNMNLNVDVLTTDYFEMKMVTPAWATNPIAYKSTTYIYFITGGEI